MLTALHLVNFKSFADANLRIGPFTIVVGTNASGKSNLRDAFRFLHGIGRGYTLAEIIGGKYGTGGQVEWAPMRGAAREIIRFGEDSFSFEANLRLEKQLGTYTIEVKEDTHSRAGFRVVREELEIGWRIIFTSHPGSSDPVNAQDDDTHLLLRMEKTGEQRKFGARIAVRPDQPALTQIEDFKQVTKAHKDFANQAIQIFANMRFLDLVPDAMRQPAFPGQLVLGDSGENLPTVLQDICADPERKSVLIEWVRELTPMDVSDFDFRSDPITGLIQLIVRETNNQEISAYSVSDGTLRFLAMLAALLGRNPARVYFFEEIDNGIHPSRLRLLLELIEKQTSKGGIQVVTTTHSPDLLAMIGDETFKNTSVVARLPGTSESIARPVADIPKASELRTSQGLGRLHASGWLEDALVFTAASIDDREEG